MKTNAGYVLVSLFGLIFYINTPLCICYFFCQTELNIFLCSFSHTLPLSNQPLCLLPELVCLPDRGICGSTMLLRIVSPFLGHHRATGHSLIQGSQQTPFIFLPSCHLTLPYQPAPLSPLFFSLPPSPKYHDFTAAGQQRTKHKQGMVFRMLLYRF